MLLCLQERATEFICPGEGFYPADDLCGDIYYLCIDGTAYIQVSFKPRICKLYIAF